LAAEGVRFDRAVASAPWTLPSHATLFTGLFQRDLSVGWSTALDTVPPTVAEHFSSLGYATGGFVANLRYCARTHGLGRGFQTYRDFSLVPSVIVGSTMAGRRLLGLYNELAGKHVLAGRKDAARVIEFLHWEEAEPPLRRLPQSRRCARPYAPGAVRPGVPGVRATNTCAGRRCAIPGSGGAARCLRWPIASLDAQLGQLFDNWPAADRWTDDRGSDVGPRESSPSTASCPTPMASTSPPCTCRC
jgi:hypothetical protein